MCGIISLHDRYADLANKYANVKTGTYKEGNAGGVNISKEMIEHEYLLTRDNLSLLMIIECNNI